MEGAIYMEDWSLSGSIERFLKKTVILTVNFSMMAHRLISPGIQRMEVISMIIPAEFQRMEARLMI